jgi:ATP-dependent DNA helicase RecQ
MAVETAVGLLRRAGAIVRTVDPDTGEERLVAGEVPATGEPPIDEAALVEKRRADEERLRAICAYATSAVCRRAYILRYFGSEEAREGCGACDRCEPSARPASKPLSDEERTVVRIALSAVARANDRFGRSRLAHFLAGSRTKEVTDAGLDRLPTHGKLSHLPLRAIGDLLEALADQGLLVRRSLDGPGSGAVLSLSDEGRRVMVEDPPLSLALPLLAPAPRGKRRATTPRRPPAALVPREAAAAVADPAISERLRAWRLDVARSSRVPPYVVFPDTTLAALAVARPTDAASLSRVPGIGPARLERWGGEILRVVRGEDGASAGATS